MGIMPSWLQVSADHDHLWRQLVEWSSWQMNELKTKNWYDDYFLVVLFLASRQQLWEWGPTPQHSQRWVLLFGGSKSTNQLKVRELACGTDMYIAYLMSMWVCIDALYISLFLMNIYILLFSQNDHIHEQNTLPLHGKHHSAIKEQNKNGV
jgi:hypothetical protein